MDAPLVHLEKSRVDDVEDAVDCETRLGDVRGHDDLPLALGRLLEDLALRLERHGRVHGQHDERWSSDALRDPSDTKIAKR